MGLHLLTFACLIAWSWRKWPDPIVDFGRELYVPWQITNGRMLYRDVASLFGPFSPYLNAIWFRLFGASLTTLAIVNIGILGAMTAGVYYILRSSTDRLTASAGTLSAVLLFGFSQYLDVGNYNFVTPYSHEATHGLALSVAAIAAWQAAVAGRRELAALCGMCCGLVVLTKPEIAAALALAMAAGLVGAWLLLDDRTAIRRAIAPLVAATIAPPLLFFLYFHLEGPMSITGAARAVAAGWIPIFTTSIARNAFYERVTGFDHPASHALNMATTFGGLVAAVGIAALLSRPARSGRFLRALLLAAQAVFLLAMAFIVPHFELSRAFPLIALSGVVYAVVSAARASGDRERRRQLMLLMWCVFAVGMLAKMLLNAQIYHYGFYLALPAVTVTAVVLLRAAPDLIARRMNQAVARRTRWLLAAAIAVSIAPHLALSNSWFRTKTVRVGDGSDAFLASAGALWQGAAVRDAVEWVERELPRDATLAVVPEGVMINYLTRRRTSVPYVNFMPPEMMAFGEASIVRAFDAHPPDYVLIVERTTSEYGHAAFGADEAYGALLMSWIRARYRTVAGIGQHRPLPSEQPAHIVAMKRIR